MTAALALRPKMSTRLFLYVPLDRAKYWEAEDRLTEMCRVAFPVAATDQFRANNAREF